MALPSRNTSIVFSLILSVCMLGAAFYFSSVGGTPMVNAESTEELLRAYAEKDSDGDLLMDWQEELYGSDPNNPSSIDPSMTDREAVESGKVEPKFSSDTSTLPSIEEQLGYAPGSDPAPGSLTETFAREFFEDYMTGKAAGELPTNDDLAAFMNDRIDALTESQAPTSGFRAGDVSSVPSSSETLVAYAVQVETLFLKNPTGTKRSELEHFASVVHAGDTEALATVQRIGKVYERIAREMRDVEVPANAIDAHVRTVNALTKMGVVIGHMGAYDSDPLIAFVGASFYEETIRELTEACASYMPVYMSAGIQMKAGESGALFLSLVQASAEVSE